MTGEKFIGLLAIRRSFFLQLAYDLQIPPANGKQARVGKINLSKTAA
jgi:hypothetical protein